MTLQDAGVFVMGISRAITKAVVLIFVYELGVYRDDIIAFFWKCKQKKTG